MMSEERSEPISTEIAEIVKKLSGELPHSQWEVFRRWERPNWFGRWFPTDLIVVRGYYGSQNVCSVAKLGGKWEASLFKADGVTFRATNRWCAHHALRGAIRAADTWEIVHGAADLKDSSFRDRTEGCLSVALEW